MRKIIKNIVHIHYRNVNSILCNFIYFILVCVFNYLWLMYLHIQESVYDDLNNMLSVAVTRNNAYVTTYNYFLKWIQKAEY
jgi:hypothetical protein